MDLGNLPQRWASHRFTTSIPYDLVVIHTNEGKEGPVSAEGLAAYTAQPHVVPGYHFVVDENSVVQTCPLSERCNGAGGVNSRALHICITGYAGQNPVEWNDDSSVRAINLAADLAATLCARFGIPHVQINDPREGHRGVCGHGDVSRYYSNSAGHTDPGLYFPWGRLFSATLDDMSAAAEMQIQAIYTALFDPAHAGPNIVADANARTAEILTKVKTLGTGNVDVAALATAIVAQLGPAQAKSVADELAARLKT